ncbi:hypothetical protein OY671_007814, partial [Metschnikowia pulcherrima]
ILMVLAKSGLRAGEVVAVTLDDIDWGAGEILVHGKGRRQAVMPLRCDVGEAIVAYLRQGRPKSTSRHSFSRMLAPHVGFTSGCAITMIARQALDRVGIHGYAHHGAHLFRHSLATDSLRSGASFDEIGQLLRHQTLERYVGMRQGSGYKYDSPARRSSDFVSFMEARGAETITVASAMEWVTKIGRQPTWAIRSTDVRCFAQHLAHFDPLTEVPPTDLVPAGRRAMPYIYSDAEIKALVAAASALPPANALRRWTYHCLFGSIAVAGLRHSEALNLHCDDVDLDQGVLTIRESKFGKSRLVPLHATTISVLRDYSAPLISS